MVEVCTLFRVNNYVILIYSSIEKFGRFKSEIILEYVDKEINCNMKEIEMQRELTRC